MSAGNDGASEFDLWSGRALLRGQQHGPARTIQCHDDARFHAELGDNLDPSRPTTESLPPAARLENVPRSHIKSLHKIDLLTTAGPSRLNIAKMKAQLNGSTERRCDKRLKLVAKPVARARLGLLEVNLELSHAFLLKPKSPNVFPHIGVNRANYLGEWRRVAILQVNEILLSSSYVNNRTIDVYNNKVISVVIADSRGRLEETCINAQLQGQVSSCPIRLKAISE